VPAISSSQVSIGASHFNESVDASGAVSSRLLKQAGGVVTLAASKHIQNYYRQTDPGDKAQIQDISWDIGISCPKDGVLDREVWWVCSTPRNVTASVHKNA
jgi:hypothetical protein